MTIIIIIKWVNNCIEYLKQCQNKKTFSKFVHFEFLVQSFYFQSRTLSIIL